MPNEGELPGLLDGRCTKRTDTSLKSARFHNHPSDRELAFERFATRFEIDRSRKASGLLVQGSTGAVAVDQGVKRPAGPVEPDRFGRDRPAQRRLTERAGCAWITLPVTVATAVVVATVGCASTRVTF